MPPTPPQPSRFMPRRIVGENAPAPYPHRRVFLECGHWVQRARSRRYTRCEVCMETTGPSARPTLRLTCAPTPTAAPVDAR